MTLLADVRAVALSRKRGFSKNVLRDALAEDEIGYRHFRELGTPKAGREAARAGDAARMYEIFCDEVLTTVRQRTPSTRSPNSPRGSPCASSASSAIRRTATAASSPTA